MALCEKLFPPLFSGTTQHLAVLDLEEADFCNFIVKFDHMDNRCDSKWTNLEPTETRGAHLLTVRHPPHLECNGL